MASGAGGDSPREVLFEFTQLGHQMRVAAIDAATSIEVIVVAPVSATRLQMESLALAKLRRRLEEQGRAGTPRLF